ncbi:MULTISPECIES: alanine racemase [unclassified Cyanobium]|uniref:alanine racemase n=1 Tax=unclassified Cyanobium TaxID=2627006 RepID=UPI0020CD5175|nr:MULTISPECIES: alanine racemase [unclassified Cyanobium]MCP9834795.1 alanine racemase [Cyanobium sp. La Preciosa 7G6]MCP9937581.1 alanine racemase [Cyanobium sp. Aljojuca 7A6]
MTSASLAPTSATEESAQPRQRAWVEVNTAAIQTNVRALQRHIGPATQLMAVVKADAYGHGALPVARAALEAGAACFGVATLAEGVQLRRAGISAPVLVLGNLTQPEELRSCLRWQLMPTLSSMREALLCQNLASGSGRTMAVQLKLDTGMARLGADWQEGPRLVAALQGMEAIDLAGIYSHLACADAPPEEDDGLSDLQQQRFESVLTSLAEQGLTAGCRHLANSAGTLRGHQQHYDLVRVGLALYGQPPAAHLAGVVTLQPALQIHARVTLLRQVGAGVGVSYGHRFRTRRPSRLAVVSIGYADGVPRQLSNRMDVLFDGRRLPQVGAITMDQLVIDATEAPRIEVGSLVTLLGEQGGEILSPLDWSERCGTIPWEILCGFKHRLPRLAVPPEPEAATEP